MSCACVEGIRSGFSLHHAARRSRFWLHRSATGALHSGSAASRVLPRSGVHPHLSSLLAARCWRIHIPRNFSSGSEDSSEGRRHSGLASFHARSLRSLSSHRLSRPRCHPGQLWSSLLSRREDSILFFLASLCLLSHCPKRTSSSSPAVLLGQALSVCSRQCSSADREDSHSSSGVGGASHPGKALSKADDLTVDQPLAFFFFALRWELSQSARPFSGSPRRTEGYLPGFCSIHSFKAIKRETHRRSTRPRPRGRSCAMRPSGLSKTRRRRLFCIGVILHAYCLTPDRLTG